MAGYARSRETTFVSDDSITCGWETVRDRDAKKYNSRAKMGVLTFTGLTIMPISRDAVTPRWLLAVGSYGARPIIRTASLRSSFASHPSDGRLSWIILRRGCQNFVLKVSLTHPAPKH